MFNSSHNFKTHGLFLVLLSCAGLSAMDASGEKRAGAALSAVDGSGAKRRKDCATLDAMGESKKHVKKTNTFSTQERIFFGAYGATAVYTGVRGVMHALERSDRLRHLDRGAAMAMIILGAGFVAAALMPDNSKKNGPA